MCARRRLSMFLPSSKKRTRRLYTSPLSLTGDYAETNLGADSQPDWRQRCFRRERESRRAHSMTFARRSQSASCLVGARNAARGCQLSRQSRRSVPTLQYRRAALAATAVEPMALKELDWVVAPTLTQQIRSVLAFERSGKRPAAGND
jgi:hypothetical protein